MRTKFCSVIKAAVLTFIVLCAIPSYGEDGVMVLGSDLDKRSFKKIGLSNLRAPIIRSASWAILWRLRLLRD